MGTYRRSEKAHTRVLRPAVGPGLAQGQRDAIGSRQMVRYKTETSQLTRYVCCLVSCKCPGGKLFTCWNRPGLMEREKFTYVSRRVRSPEGSTVRCERFCDC